MVIKKRFRALRQFLKAPVLKGLLNFDMYLLSFFTDLCETVPQHSCDTSIVLTSIHIGYLKESAKFKATVKEKIARKDENIAEEHKN